MRFGLTSPTQPVAVSPQVSEIAISPDGQHLVYASELDSSASVLMVRSLNELEGRPLEATASRGAFSPFISPDNEWVGFGEVRGRTLQRVSMLGGPSISICDLPGPGFLRGASWGTDDTIVFGTSDPDGLWRVSVAGGEPQALTTTDPTEPTERHMWPQILPGGRAVLFTIQTTDDLADAQVAVLDLEKGTQRVVVPGGYAPQYVSSGHLVYVSGGTLLAVGFDSERLTVTTNPMPLMENVAVKSSGAASFNVSGAGALVYVTTTDVLQPSPLVWVDREGRTEVIDSLPPRFYQTPRLSPDGNRVLVVADGDAWILDLTSGRESRVTADGETERYAAWSPSGDVTYTSSRGPDGGMNVWMQPADGSAEARQLTALDGLVHFDSWAPDGQTFAAHHHTAAGQPPNQLMVPLEGEPSFWLQREFRDGNAVFSPDGRYVAHTSTQTGQYEIYVRPFPGPGGQTTVSVGGGEQPTWAPTGELFYRRRSDYAMMVVEVVTDPTLAVGPPRELFRGNRGAMSIGTAAPAQYAVTDDGQRFLMNAALMSEEQGSDVGSAAQITLVHNWVEELRQIVPIP